MSRLLYQAELLRHAVHPRLGECTFRAPIRNRTVDLLLTMEMLYRLSYWGEGPTQATGQRCLGRNWDQSGQRRTPAGLT